MTAAGRARRGARASALALCAAWTLSAGCQRAAPPNIILYVVDTLRADAVGGDGNPGVRTPAMERVAHEGLRFRRAYANASWTRPSMGSLLTGTYPRTHGAIGRHDALRAGVATLAGGLHAAGYRTAAVFANPNIGTLYGFGEGFDDFIALYPARMVHDATVPQAYVGTADHVVDRAVEWLRGRPTQPFFLLVFTVDPHAPYEPPAPYNTMYDPEYTGKVDGSLATLFGLLVAARRGNPPPERDVRHLRALYDGEVAFNDAQLARLLAELDRTRLAQQTLFLITSDHGEEFYEHGSGEHGHSLYEELIHVPLLLRWPGRVAESRTYGGVVQLLDLYPTLLHVAGAPVPAGPGRDLTDIILGRASASVPPVAYAEEHLDEHNLQMVLLDHRKLIYDAAIAQPLTFDLRKDPGEHHPLPGLPAPDLAFAISAIEQQNRPPADSTPRVVGPTQIPDSARQAMQALGYGDPAQNP